MEYQTKSDYHSDGLLPKRVRIDSKRTVRFSGSLAANAKDRQLIIHLCWKSCILGWCCSRCCGLLDPRTGLGTVIHFAAPGYSVLINSNGIFGQTMKKAYLKRLSQVL